jgi:hypothetical protein
VSSASYGRYYRNRMLRDGQTPLAFMFRNGSKVRVTSVLFVRRDRSISCRQSNKSASVAMRRSIPRGDLRCFSMRREHTLSDDPGLAYGAFGTELPIAAQQQFCP